MTRPQTLTPQQVTTLIDGLELYSPRGFYAYEAQLLQLALLIPLYTGLRLAEMHQLLVSDFYFHGALRQTLSVRPEIAKGGYPRSIPLCSPLTTAIDRTNTRWWLPACNLQDHYIFCKRDPHLRYSRRWIQRHLSALGLQTIHIPVWPHLLRHTFGTYVYRTAGMRVAQDLLGHRSIVSTQIYTHPNDEERTTAVLAIPNIISQQT